MERSARARAAVRQQQEDAHIPRSVAVTRTMRHFSASTDIATARAAPLPPSLEVPSCAAGGASSAVRAAGLSVRKRSTHSRAQPEAIM